MTGPARARLRAAAATLLLACGAPPPPVAPPPVSPPPTRLRAAEAPEPVPGVTLPGDVRPLRYGLDLDVTGRRRLSGVARVELSLERARRALWVHGRALHVAAAHVEVGDRRIAARWEPVRSDGLVRVALGEPVGPGSVTLVVRYEARTDHLAEGLPWERQGAIGAAFGTYTQLEPLGARLVFPCLDEPRFRAPIELTLTVDRGDVAVSSSPVVERRAVGDRDRVRFAPTPPIPTYLLAWGTGDLVEVPAAPIDGNEVRERALPLIGVAVRGHPARVAPAVELTRALLPAIERLLGAPYPYRELRIFAVPGLGPAGMENAGLVTLDEELVEIDPDLSGAARDARRRRLSFLVAHELGHQWFGDLVGIESFRDMWLKEALATWLEARAVEAVDPGPHVALHRLASVETAARAAERMAPLSPEPTRSADLVRAVARVAPDHAGAAVLAGLERVLGRARFDDGIRRFVRDHAGGTAGVADLGAALGPEAARVLGRLVADPGMASVAIDVDCAAAPAITVAQRRYAPLGAPIPRDGRYSVPLCLRWGAPRASGEACVLLEAREMRVEVDACPAWVAPEPGVGLYHAAPSARLLEAALARPDPAAAELRQLSASVHGGIRSGDLRVDEALPLLPRLLAGGDAVAAMDALSLVARVRHDLTGEAERARVDRWAADLLRPLHRRLGWERGGRLGEEVLRFLALEIEDPRVRREAARRGRRRLGRTPRAADRRRLDPVDAIAVAVALQEGADVPPERAREAAVVAGGTWSRDAAAAARARAEALVDPAVWPLAARQLPSQLRRAETRAAIWAWVLEHESQVRGAALGWGARGRPPRPETLAAAALCSDADALSLARMGQAPGPAAAGEITACARLVEVHGPLARAFFSGSARAR